MRARWLTFRGLLFTALQPLHELPPACGKLLEAAAILHDVGHFVSAVSHHKHSYYVVSNSDMAGFTDRERILIAALCRYHRSRCPTPCTAHIWRCRRRSGTAPDDDPDSAAGGQSGSQPRTPYTRSGLPAARREGVVLQVRATGDIDLEQWAAERAGEAFQQIYNRPVSLVKARE